MTARRSRARTIPQPWTPPENPGELLAGRLAKSLKAMGKIKPQDLDGLTPCERREIVCYASMFAESLQEWQDALRDEEGGE